MKYRVDYYEELVDMSSSEGFKSDEKKYLGSSSIESDLNLDDFILELKKDEDGAYASDGYEIESTEYHELNLTVIEITDFFGQFEGRIEVNKKIGAEFSSLDGDFDQELKPTSFLIIEDVFMLEEGQIQITDLKNEFPEIRVVANYQKQYEWGASGFWDALIIAGTIEVIIQVVKYLKDKGVKSISIDDEELELIKDHLYKHGFPGKKYTFRGGGVKELDGKKMYKLTDGKFNIDVTIENGIIVEIKSYEIKYN